MISYFGRLSGAKLTLWCYLAWYLAIVALCWDPSPVLWSSSLGISVLVGFALVLATRQPSQKREGWVVFRLFLVPFCVSSYSALIRGKGFILVFPADFTDLLTGLLACVAVIALHVVCRVVSLRKK